MAIELTPSQQAVVEDRGGNLLVSAAAGSGKTRVLVERLMGYVEQGEDIDRFLVITFTNAAAAELRQRIAAGIHQRLALHPENRHLRRNATLVYQAPICTIDAFCLDFLRQWGHLAGLDPDFRLCDEAQGEALRQQALEEVLETRYAAIGQDSAFAALVDDLAGERDDQTLADVVLEMHRRVQAQADPVGWLMDRRRDFDLSRGAMPEDTPWGRLLLEDAAGLTSSWRVQLEQLVERLQEDSLLMANYAPSLRGTLDGLDSLLAGLKEGWDRAAACFPIPFPRLGSKRGECDEVLKAYAKALRERCKKQMTDLGARFGVTAAQAMEDLRAVGPAMTALLEVTAQFDQAFAALKGRKRLADFADLEHLTVRLLTDGSGQPTQLARDWGRQYVEIMVDEYQDTNAVQNAIFNALSNGHNLFFVGDVKQSIYRFRLADPTLFLDKYRRWPLRENAGEGESRKILLSDNFRSRPEVLEGVNFLFRNIMTSQAGELDYTQAEALRPGRAFQPDPACRLELCCVDLEGLTDYPDRGKTPKDLVVARCTAQRIRQLLDTGWREDGARLQPEDIVILLRSPGPVLRHYAAALDELSIPWSAEGGREFFGTTEISVAISLLQIVDNPVQDVPLLAVLRSPLFAFTPDRLAQLRDMGGGGTVYDAVTAGAGQGEEDCLGFLALLADLRELAAQESSHRLLWQIYDRTDLPAVFAAMPDGRRRRANLMALYDEACRFEAGGHRGLMAFLLHLTRMAENGLSVPVPGEEAGGVRILSIHKSKGLEFPVVLLCGLERQFNEADTKATILFHPELGLGPKRTDRGRMLRYTTIARDAVALRLKQQLRAEEMRLLYVAMTRAERKLILFAAVNGPGTSLEGLAARAQCPPPPRQVAQARSMAEWVLIPALCRPDSDPLWETLSAPRPDQVEEPGPEWEVKLLRGADYEQFTFGGPTSSGPADGLELPEGLEEQLSWRYAHEGAVDVPSKLTATQLKGRERDREVAQDGVELRPAPPEVSLRRPVFEGQRPLTPAQRGTALHMVMQYLDYGRIASEEQVREEIARLVAGQYITPQQGQAVHPRDILVFFRSELGQRLLASPHVEREYKFSMLAPAGDYYPQAGAGEEVLLQGVVDCWFREADGTVTVLDFKTDRVTRDTVLARAESYRPQLEAYTRALAAAMGVCVGRRVLWFFALGQGVEL
ncbi:MAG TPA: helicase-exonuclease AddAB subunit AddA [Candidatus Enterenecus stercoripullorum]|nr:helicase-exonuclease AddAB subunit AddA [Candidatus Enterenecus stercoripullorum]